MKVRYNIVVAVVILVLGAVSEFLGLWLTALGEFHPSVIIGLFFIAIGVLYIVRPYFWVYPTSVEVRALVGPLRREFTFQTLEFDGGRLFAVHSDGTRKKVPVARWLANSSDWAAVMPPTHGS